VSRIDRSGKLTFLIRQLEVGGAERQLVLLAREFHRRGYSVSVATYYPGGAFEHELRQTGITVHSLQKSGRWDIFRFLIRLVSWIWRERPAVVFGYLSSANLLLLLLRPVLKIRGIAVVCGVRASEFDLSTYDWLTQIVEIAQRQSLRFADAVICNSMAGRDFVVASGARPSRCFVVENGIDSNRFLFVEEGRARWRHALGVDQSQILIGMVGRHDPVKGCEFFIAAAAALAESHGCVRFVVAGPEMPGYSEVLRTEVHRLALSDRWRWTGHTDDLAGIYSALDVFCLPSTSEGFPNVVGEAMSCGLPCVVTDVGDAARLVGQVGWVVPARASALLAKGLACAIEALPHWDRTLPRHRIEEHYGIDCMTDRTMAVLAPWLESGS
jgi:glycosyltransferase involved in cell wall biosynthesis